MSKDLIKRINLMLKEEDKKIEWDKVWEALMDAAEDIFDEVDKEKLEGVYDAISEKNPKDTEDAIEIGIDMLRSE